MDIRPEVVGDQAKQAGRSFLRHNRYTLTVIGCTLAAVLVGWLVLR